MLLRDRIRDRLNLVFTAGPAVETIGGLIKLRFQALGPWIGLIHLARGGRIWPPALLIPVMIVPTAAWHIANDTPDVPPVRYLQAILWAAFLSFLVTRPRTVLRDTAVVISVLCHLGLLAELVSKSDIRGAFLNVDLGFFADSGGATGVQLIANGNVYAAAISGVVGMVLLVEGHRALGASTLFLALTTGSRSLVLALLLAGLVSVAPSRVGRRLSRMAPLLLAGFVAVQPLIFLNIEYLLSDQWSERVADLSGRYASFGAYSRMGAENFFGVGYFRGTTLRQYFPIGQRLIDPHNTTIGIFGEMGVAAYLVWIAFMYRVGKAVCGQPGALLVIGFSLWMYSFLDGLNEWSLWFPIAYGVVITREARQGTVDLDAVVPSTATAVGSP